MAQVWNSLQQRERRQVNINFVSDEISVLSRKLLFSFLINIEMYVITDKTFGSKHCGLSF